MSIKSKSDELKDYLTNVNYSDNISIPLKNIITKVTEIINAVAEEKGTKFEPDQKRQLISAFVGTISNEFIVVSKEIKNKMTRTNNNQSKTAVNQINDRIKYYIECCIELKDERKLKKVGQIENLNTFYNPVNYNKDEFRRKLEHFLNVDKSSTSKISEIFKLLGNNPNSEKNSPGFLLSVMKSLSNINNLNSGNNNILIYEIITKIFISNICDLLELCTVTRNSNGTLLKTEYKINNDTHGINSNINCIINQQELNKLRTIIQNAVNAKTKFINS